MCMFSFEICFGLKLVLASDIFSYHYEIISKFFRSTTFYKHLFRMIWCIADIKRIEVEILTKCSNFNFHVCLITFKENQVAMIAFVMQKLEIRFVIVSSIFCFLFITANLVPMVFSLVVKIEPSRQTECRKFHLDVSMSQFMPQMVILRYSKI